MKRSALALLGAVLLAGVIVGAVGSFTVRHPASGQEITVPGQMGTNALLVNGWKTTPRAAAVFR